MDGAGLRIHGSKVVDAVESAYRVSAGRQDGIAIGFIFMNPTFGQGVGSRVILRPVDTGVRPLEAVNARSTQSDPQLGARRSGGTSLGTRGASRAIPHTELCNITLFRQLYCAIKQHLKLYPFAYWGGKLDAQFSRRRVPLVPGDRKAFPSRDI